MVAWVVVLLLIFIFAFLYQVVSVPMIKLDSQVRNITDVSNSSSAVSTLDIINSVWQYWPIFLILVLVLWAFYVSTKKEPVWYGGYEEYEG